MAADLYYPTSKNAVQKTLASQLLNTATTGDAITFTDVDGVQNKPGVLVINRVDQNGAALPSSREFISYSGTSGNTVLIETRNVDGSASAKTHVIGSIVEFISDAVWAQRLIDQFLIEHSKAGLHSEAALDSMIAGTEAQGDIIYHNGTIWTRLPKGTDGQVLTQASNVPSWANASASGGTAFWSDVPGTPTRVSDTQFTITDTSNTNLYDLLFKKGVILKWLESTTFQTAMVISSSYSSDAVTINIVGDSLTAGFTEMKYAIPKAMSETFIIAGTFPAAATTNLSKSWIPECDVYFLSADLNVTTAGSGTGSTVVDINDDGSTKWTTKPTLTTTGTADIDNVADNPSTAVAAGSVVTVDVDSVTATTAPSDGYVKVFYYPVDWRYRA
jgi:hypothetical protein